MDGADETGVSLFEMDEGLDTGPVILQRPVPIAADDSLDSLEKKLSLASAELLMEGLSLLARGEAKKIPQDGEATLAPKLSKEDAWIDWREKAVAIERKIRAMDSRPGAATLLEGKVLKVYRARAVGSPESSVPPGTIVEILPDAIVVAAGNGALALTELQLEGKKRMDAASFLRGKRIEAGTKLG